MNRDQMEFAAKNTVGYSEAENKESFMIGVRVGLITAENKYLARIKELEKLSKTWEDQYNHVTRHIKEVSKILSFYAPETEEIK